MKHLRFLVLWMTAWAAQSESLVVAPKASKSFAATYSLPSSPASSWTTPSASQLHLMASCTGEAPCPQVSGLLDLEHVLKVSGEGMLSTDTEEDIEYDTHVPGQIGAFSSVSMHPSKRNIVAANTSRSMLSEGLAIGLGLLSAATPSTNTRSPAAAADVIHSPGYEASHAMRVLGVGKSFSFIEIGHNSLRGHKETVPVVVENEEEDAEGHQSVVLLQMPLSRMGGAEGSALHSPAMFSSLSGIDEMDMRPNAAKKLSFEEPAVSPVLHTAGRRTTADKPRWLSLWHRGSSVLLQIQLPNFLGKGAGHTQKMARLLVLGMGFAAFLVLLLVRCVVGYSAESKSRNEWASTSTQQLQCAALVVQNRAAAGLTIDEIRSAADRVPCKPLFALLLAPSEASAPPPALVRVHGHIAFTEGSHKQGLVAPLSGRRCVAYLCAAFDLTDGVLTEQAVNSGVAAWMQRVGCASLGDSGKRQAALEPVAFEERRVPFGLRCSHTGMLLPVDHTTAALAGVPTSSCFVSQFESAPDGLQQLFWRSRTPSASAQRGELQRTGTPGLDPLVDNLLHHQERQLVFVELCLEEGCGVTICGQLRPVPGATPNASTGSHLILSAPLSSDAPRTACQHLTQAEQQGWVSAGLQRGAQETAAAWTQTMWQRQRSMDDAHLLAQSDVEGALCPAASEHVAAPNSRPTKPAERVLVVRDSAVFLAMNALK